MHGVNGGNLHILKFSLLGYIFYRLAVYTRTTSLLEQYKHPVPAITVNTPGGAAPIELIRMESRYIDLGMILS